MPKIPDPWDHHDWDSGEYVARWAERQDHREVERKEPFRLMARTLPYDQLAPIKILDLGAGYGALTRFLLNHFCNATAVCQDGSDAMAKLGRQRMNDLKGRFTYVLCDFSKSGWSRRLEGPFAAVVSSIAIHNVRSADVIEAIYRESHSLVQSGGCFLNFDRMTPSLTQQMRWLRAAGFKDVQCFWKSGRRALVGGLRK
jgi:ubiquinone/menaquinone biosynthesis C-methylase UbiE